MWVKWKSDHVIFAQTLSMIQRKAEIFSGAYKAPNVLLPTFLTYFSDFICCLSPCLLTWLRPHQRTSRLLLWGRWSTRNLPPGTYLAKTLTSLQSLLPSHLQHEACSEHPIWHHDVAPGPMEPPWFQSPHLCSFFLLMVLMGFQRPDNRLSGWLVAWLFLSPALESKLHNGVVVSSIYGCIQDHRTVSETEQASLTVCWITEFKLRTGIFLMNFYPCNKL